MASEPGQTGTDQTVSTWAAIKAILVMLPKIFDLIDRLGAKMREKAFNDWISELDDTTRALEKATTTEERVLAAKRLRDLARGIPSKL